MFLEWWMVGVLLLWWFASLWDIRRTVFDEGAQAAIQGLIDSGYIDVDDNDEVIGLCNVHKRRVETPVEDAAG